MQSSPPSLHAIVPRPSPPFAVQPVVPKAGLQSAIAVIPRSVNSDGSERRHNIGGQNDAPLSRATPSASALARSAAMASSAVRNLWSLRVELEEKRCIATRYFPRHEPTQVLGPSTRIQQRVSDEDEQVIEFPVGEHHRCGEAVVDCSE